MVFLWFSYGWVITRPATDVFLSCPVADDIRLHGDLFQQLQQIQGKEPALNASVGFPSAMWVCLKIAYP